MNFALFLLILLVVTGAVWLLEKYVLGKKRPKDAKQPWWIEYSVSFFPMILIVLPAYNEAERIWPARWTPASAVKWREERWPSGRWRWS